MARTPQRLWYQNSILFSLKELKIACFLANCVHINFETDEHGTRRRKEKKKEAKSWRCHPPAPQWYFINIYHDRSDGVEPRGHHAHITCTMGGKLQMYEIRSSPRVRFSVISLQLCIRTIQFYVFSLMLCILWWLIRWWQLSDAQNTSMSAHDSSHSWRPSGTSSFLPFHRLRPIKE